MQVYEWFKRFEDGRDNAESDDRLRRALTSNNNKKNYLVRSAVWKNPSTHISELAFDLKTSFKKSEFRK